MTSRNFYSLVRKNFNPILEPEGFSCEKSKYGTFYRQTDHDVTHIIMPDLGTKGEWYDIRVFATSKLITPQFETLFPDSFGIPSDSFSYLNHRTGVGIYQDLFDCNTITDFNQSFEYKVAPALKIHALPFLSKINSIKDLIPVTRNKFYLAVTQFIIGKKDEAIPVLEKELIRLEYIGSKSEIVTARIDFINNLLKEKR